MKNLLIPSFQQALGSLKRLTRSYRPRGQHLSFRIPVPAGRERFSGPAFDKLFDKLFKILKKDGPSALVNASAAELSDDLKLTAFACAVDIALADGVIEEEEKDIINQLAEVLGVPEKTAISIIEVMIIKNKA